MNRFIIFLSILSLIMGLGYWYIGAKLISSEYSFSQKIISWLIIFSLWASTPGFYFISLSQPESNWNKAYSMIAFLSFGFFTILFSLILLGDIGTTIAHHISNFISSQKDIEVTSDIESRKEFLFRFWKPTALALGVTITGYGFYKASRKVDLEEVEIPIKNLNPDLDGFTIVQISDIHVGPTIKHDFIQYLVNTINSLNADLVAITGDLVDGPVQLLKRHVHPLKNLKSVYGTFFVTGNHEYYSGAMSWIKELKNLGVNVLLNENQIIDHGKSKLLIGGVTDLTAGNFSELHETNPEKAIESNIATDFKLLLAHQPKSIYRAAKAGFDLQLSGHTHGGQYFPGNILIYLFQPFVKGLHKYLDTWVYVSKGTGYWGPPIRVGADPEITIVKLKKA
ncbi:MAG: metallophosphoesterase [Leptospiraceae bacterium]|nr:metallophosphoesterase [Leptospiraceae bacterium]